MPYSWKIEYTAPGEEAVDITALCAGFSITARIDAFCREMTLDVIDKAFYDSLDFTTVPEDPQIEIFTKIDAAWNTQGKFFIERPSIAAAPRSDEVRGIWGRSITAKLSEPYATKITKVWETDTTFFAIAAELCTACGLTFDEAKSDVIDFAVFARTYEAENRYPADILSELCMLAGAVLSCDREGDLFIRAYDYSPASGDAAIADADIASFSETPVFPSFGNRVKIMPTGAASGYSVTLYAGDPCISARTSFRKPVFARVTDADGMPIQNIPVAWALSFEGGGSGLAKLSHPATNTQTVRFFREKKKAESFYRVKTDFPAKTILGIYAYRDVSRSHNFAAAGYTIDGDTVSLTESLEYCDQTVLVDYEVEGVAVNYLINNGSGTLGQTATLTADVEGQSAAAEIYINNGCRCPVTLSIKANPSSISVGSSADILVYAEEAGGPVTDGRQVFLSQSVKIGFLKSLVLCLAAIAVDNEQVQAVNVIAGVTQCELSMFPASVYGVWTYTGEPGEITRTEENLYSAHQGKIIELTDYLPTGTPLVVAYYAHGAGLTYFRGGYPGTTRITAQMEGNTEEPISAYADVTVQDESTPIQSGYTPPTWDPYSDPEPQWDDRDFYDARDFEEIAGEGNEGYIETDCVQLCEEQYPAGAERDQCIEDCEEENDPQNQSDDGEGFDETDDEPDCEGKKCAEGEECCFAGEDYGCHPSAQCTGSAPYEPPEDCEAQCDDELSRFGTTRVNDEGSMRPISEIVTHDFGYAESDPGYWEKYEELKAAVLAACLEDCEACEEVEEITTDAPETLAPDSDAYIVITGGKGPFTAALTGGVENGFTIAVDGREVVLSQSADGCGSAEITITDACNVTKVVQIRSTSGSWGHIGSSPVISGAHTDIGGSYTLTQGKYKQSAVVSPLDGCHGFDELGCSAPEACTGASYCKCSTYENGCGGEISNLAALLSAGNGWSCMASGEKICCFNEANDAYYCYAISSTGGWSSFEWIC